MDDGRARRVGEATARPVCDSPMLAMGGVGFSAGGHTILRDVTFTLAAGRRTCVLGHNGAGKSVLLRLAHGLLTATAGKVVVGTEAQAMVFQRPVMLRRSVIGNVLYGLRQARAHALPVREILERAGLARYAERQARVLSGGEQQRVALARAWATSPRLLFLDEPTASLDPRATRDVERLIAQMQGTGITTVMVTHSLAQARRMSDDVLFLHEGRVVEHAPTQEFFARPRSPEAAAFLEEEIG